MRGHVRLSVALVMMLSAMFLITSCAKKKVAQVEPVSTVQPEVQEVVPDIPVEEPEETAQQPEEELPQIEAAVEVVKEKELNNENIYFAYDSSDLSDKARLILDNNAAYLREHSSLSVTVEGHCDDRGSEAYNNALGLRRAESVKKFLIARGISTDRLVTVSYGENKPASRGHDEAAWAMNRRAQIVVNLLSAGHKSRKN